MSDDADRIADRLGGQAFATMRHELLTKAAFIVLANSQQRTPVKTGTLRRSETTKVETDRAFVGTNVAYAGIVHAHRPFFVQGADDSEAQIQRLMRDVGAAFWVEVAKP